MESSSYINYPHHKLVLYAKLILEFDDAGAANCGFGLKSQS